MKLNIAVIAVAANATKQISMHVGIDYGSKLAGTTSLCFKDNNKFCFLQSEKKKDADLFILHHVQSLKLTHVFIDAPLSLPGVYTGTGEDYFYRVADKHLKAMSPMFIGGLTARAIKMKVTLQQQGISVFETYPAALVRHLFPAKEIYKNNMEDFCDDLKIQFPKIHFEFSSVPNWHQVDSLLAWLSGHRYLHQQSHSVGDPVEGIIVI